VQRLSKDEPKYAHDTVVQVAETEARRWIPQVQNVNDELVADCSASSLERK
jgi:hypothetical protein